MSDKEKPDDVEPPDAPKKDEETLSAFRNQLAHFSFDIPDVSKYYADLLDSTRLFDYSVVSKVFEQYTELQRSTAASLSSVLDSFKWLQAPSGKGRDEEIEKLKREFDNYKEQVKRQHIYTRLDPEGQTKYFEDESFRKLFDSKGDVQPLSCQWIYANRQT